MRLDIPLLPILIDVRFHFGVRARPLRTFRFTIRVLMLVVGITAIFHADQFLQSWAAVMSISALTVLQCFLRERTGNLWDCIICHLVFNATSILASLLRHG